MSVWSKTHAVFDQVSLPGHCWVTGGSGVGADNIAQHYKYTLSSIFTGPTATDFAILVEDDMVSSVTLHMKHLILRIKYSSG